MRRENWQRSDRGYERSELIQAYRLYTLALAQSPDFGAMNRLREEKGLDQLAQWRLAAAYAGCRPAGSWGEDDC